MKWLNKKNGWLTLLLLASISGRAEWRDVTSYYLPNPSFDNNSTNHWLWNSNASSQRSDFGCMEFWNGMFNFYTQDRVSLPKGRYRLSVQGYYRCGDYEPSYADYVNGSELITAHLYALHVDEDRRDMIPMASAFSFSFNRRTNGCWTNDNIHYYPNQMSSAALAFEQGAYQNVLYFESEGEDFLLGIINGTVNYSNWCIFDNFKLEFDGDVVMATGISVTAEKTSILEGEAVFCTASITPDDAMSKQVSWSSSNPSVATVDQTGTVRGVSPGSVRITATTTDGSNLSSAVTVSVRSASEVRWVDVTDVFLKNPGFDNNSTEHWNWSSNASSQQSNFGCMEFWNGTFSFYQLLSGLPKGLFRLSMQGFYRVGDNDFAYQSHENGSENLTAVLDAGGRTMPLHSVYDFSMNDYFNGCWTYNWMDFYPDGMEAASEAFSLGAYLNQLVFENPEENGGTYIGVSNEAYTNSNWCIFDNFKLEFSGDIILAQQLEVSIDKPNIIISETAQCSYTIKPENTLVKTVTWTSSDERVAIVDQYGLVQGVGNGVARITATTTDGSNLSASVEVSVSNGGFTDGSIVVNEIMVSNVDEFVSPANNFDGWVELYNPTDQTVRLSGLYLSDDPGNLQLWRMPYGIGVIPAHGYKVLWFDSNDLASTNAPIKLDVDGGTLYISDNGGRLITSQTYPEGIERVSYARKTDGSWGYNSVATPGEANDPSHFATAQLDDPVVDCPSQLFTHPLSVHVGIPAGCTLRYTMDGTLPTLENGNTSTTGQFEVSSTSNYRFRLFADGMLPSRVTTRSYISSDQDYSLPVLSVVADPRFLYDDYLGVLVKGVNGRPGNGQQTACNWNMSWDRPVNFSYLSTDGEMVFNQDANLEMCGGWSRAWLPHAFKLKGNKELGGNKNLDYPFFEEKPYIRNRTLQVRNGGNDNVCRFKDPALQTIVSSSGIDIDYQSYQPVHEFINGEYIGVLNVREPNNKHFVYANYGWDEDEIDQFEMSPDSGYVQKCGSAESFTELVDYLSADAANSGTYAEICKRLDIDEYIYYMAAQLYMGNWDWPQNNVKGFTKAGDGRYRFVLFDLDGAFSTKDPFNVFMGKELYTFDQLYPMSLGRITQQIRFVTLFRNLLGNAQFRRKFIDAYCIMGGSVFEANRAIGIIDSLAERVNPAMSLEGLSVNNTANSLRGNLSEWLEPATWALRNYELFDLAGSDYYRYNLTSDTEDAQLLINDIPVPTGEFNGYLFPPVRLKAVAPAGFAFQGWSLSSGEETTLLSYNAGWSYYDQGSLDGTNWTSPSYPEYGWKTGYAPLGYGKNDIATTLDYGPDGANKRPTAYFRARVHVQNKPAGNDRFSLHYTADDGFIVYVNGTEAGRYNMPSGNVDYNSYSTTYANGNPDRGMLTLPANLFHEGDNVIAVELHNNSAGSTDLYWDASVTTTVSATSTSFYSTQEEINLPYNNVSLRACYRPLTVAEMDEAGQHRISVNEVSGSNDCFVNEYGKKADWVELYNASDQEVDLEGYYLTDDLSKPQKYLISREGTSVSTKIAAHGHLIIWCDKQPTTNRTLHASFKIAGEGGLVALTTPDGKTTDILRYDMHDGNSTVGRYPDGSEKVYLMNVPTISKPNILTSYMTMVDQTVGIRQVTGEVSSANGFRMVYGSQHLILKSEEGSMASIEIFTTDGRMADRQSVALHHGSARVDVSHLAPGFYIARASDDSGTMVACKFLK